MIGRIRPSGIISRLHDRDPNVPNNLNSLGADLGHARKALAVLQGKNKVLEKLF